MPRNANKRKMGRLNLSLTVETLTIINTLREKEEAGTAAAVIAKSVALVHTLSILPEGKSVRIRIQNGIVFIAEA